MIHNDTHYSPVGNISLLELLLEEDCIGDYLLLLAQDVKKDPRRYIDFMAKYYHRFPRATVILDNGAAEGQVLIMHHLSILASELGVTYLVLPDVLGDHRLTVQAHTYALTYAPPTGVKFMAVVQGTTIPEIQVCINQHVLNDIHNQISAWAVPRCLVELVGSREFPLTLLGSEPPHLRCIVKQPIHLLGCSKDMYGDLTSVEYTGVMGIDSANPIVMGINGLRIRSADNETFRWAHMPRPLGYMEFPWTRKDVTATIIDNIQTMMMMTKRKGIEDANTGRRITPEQIVTPSTIH